MPWIFHGTEEPIFTPWPEEDWFIVGQISRWLAKQAGGNADLIAVALLRDFKTGKFDGPWKTNWDASEAADDFVAFPDLQKDVDLRWQIRWPDRFGRHRRALVDSGSAQALFLDPSEVGGEHDPSNTFWVCKEAINQWCDWNDIKRPQAWPAPDRGPEQWATHDEILRAFKTIGPAKIWKIAELIEDVARLLGMRVSRRTFEKAKKVAAAEGIIRLFKRGNPGKAR